MFRAADEFWDVAWSNLFEANQTKPQEGPRVFRRSSHEMRLVVRSAPAAEGRPP
jgi:hypothetical protein